MCVCVITTKDIIWRTTGAFAFSYWIKKEVVVGEWQYIPKSDLQVEGGDVIGLA